MKLQELIAPKSKYLIDAYDIHSDAKEILGQIQVSNYICNALSCVCM